MYDSQKDVVYSRVTDQILLIMINIFHKFPFFRKIALYILNRVVYIMPDTLYLSIVFYVKVGYSMDFKNPKTYNQKLQWLKLYDQQPTYTTMVDKVEVKEYVSKLIGEKYIIPTLGVWKSFNEIDFKTMPNQFVLKTSHGGGNCGVYICKSKDNINRKELGLLFEKAMKQNIYLYNKEWAYKNVPRRILAEQYLEEIGVDDLHDYKVLCFHGQPKLIEFHSGRNSGNHTQDFYTPEWELTDITQEGYGQLSSQKQPQPDCLDEMINLSSLLSAEIPHCRVDWYVVQGKLYFGEITFFDSGGFCPFDRFEDDELLGSWIDLKKVKRI